VKRALLCLIAVAALGSASLAAADTTPGPVTIPADVTVANVAVGGLASDAAAVAVQEAFDQPLELRVAGVRVGVTPDLLGATANVDVAIERALAATPGTHVPLGVTIDQPVTSSFVASLARRFDRSATDARLMLRRGRPFITKEHVGRKLDQRRSVRQIVAALTSNLRDPLVLTTRSVVPAVTRRNVGPVIVIHRGDNRLFLYRGTRFWRAFGVATGQHQYPTPLGRFRIVVKWRNPWWYPPASPWAKGQKPIPPGPGNPLGTRWMGLSTPGVGIHGTPSDGSIGYSVSHGCIRMHIPEAEWLFNHVDVGTTVFIVPH
jgi:lipoprotein-anchoring transpeptidase ErfK/SrfK